MIYWKRGLVARPSMVFTYSGDLLVERLALGFTGSRNLSQDLPVDLLAAGTCHETCHEIYLQQGLSARHVWDLLAAETCRETCHGMYLQQGLSMRLAMGFIGSGNLSRDLPWDLLATGTFRETCR